jgi:hypothetical protein
MTPIDSLKVGDWVAIVGRADKPREPKWLVSGGRPWCIAAISLPFIAGRCAGQVVSIDVRFWNLQKVTTRYAMLIQEALVNTGPVAAPAPSEPCDCPNCRTRHRA